MRIGTYCETVHTTRNRIKMHSRNACMVNWAIRVRRQTVQKPSLKKHMGYFFIENIHNTGNKVMK